MVWYFLCFLGFRSSAMLCHAMLCYAIPVYTNLFLVWYIDMLPIDSHHWHMSNLGHYTTTLPTRWRSSWSLRSRGIRNSSTNRRSTAFCTVDVSTPLPFTLILFFQILIVSQVFFFNVLFVSVFFLIYIFLVFFVIVLVCFFYDAFT